jgi:aldose 1-epimerase
MYDEDVTNTPFDFRVAKLVGRDINQSNVNVQLKRGRGYDHNYILTKNQRNELSLAARVIERESGRKMDVYTKASCMQFFSGNFFDGTDIGKSGKPILSRESFAIETQAYPDAPNQEGKQSIILHPDDIFSSITIYDFSTVKR